MIKAVKAVACCMTAMLLFTACGSGGTTDNGGQTGESNITEEILMENSNREHKCVSLAEELNISYTSGTDAKAVTDAYTWVMNELVLVSASTYKKPVYDVTVDLVLTNGTVTYTQPGFWDGKNVWRVRFVCPSAGTWTYKTVCSNTEDAGLNGISGTINCVEYTGALDIYKHGFIKTTAGTRYFQYADGTPFFYLGDTHWAMAQEPIENFKQVVKKRAEQGFTVMQSEPLGASFDMTDGVTTADINGFKKYDEYFYEIADKGMVHANASLFFPSKMTEFIKKYGGYTKTSLGTAFCKKTLKTYEMYEISDSVKAELKVLVRYWVARYSAFPVMWTLGQEVDNSYYWSGESSHADWSSVNNPYINVADYFGELDAYKSPLSAHQEGMNTTNASQSVFRNCSAHTWYAAQWKWPKFNKMLDFSYQKDYWENGQGKPSVLYEGYYCYLWTKNFGARAQGWWAYTNGTFGYGWGGQDTWDYLSTYDEDKDTTYDGIDVVTAADKTNATWESAMEFSSTYQMQYMRDFLENTVGEWWSLIPRFDDTAYFTPASDKVLYTVASNEDLSKTLIYFYNFSDSALAEKPNATEAEAKQTGTVNGFSPKSEYVYVWFNPVTGEKLSAGTFVADANGAVTIGEKATSDMVLYIVKK